MFRTFVLHNPIECGCCNQMYYGFTVHVINAIYFYILISLCKPDFFFFKYSLLIHICKTDV